MHAGRSDPGGCACDNSGLWRSSLSDDVSPVRAAWIAWATGFAWRQPTMTMQLGVTDPRGWENNHRVKALAESKNVVLTGPIAAWARP